MPAPASSLALYCPPTHEMQRVAGKASSSKRPPGQLVQAVAATLEYCPARQGRHPTCPPAAALAAV